MLNHCHYYVQSQLPSSKNPLLKNCSEQLISKIVAHLRHDPLFFQKHRVRLYEQNVLPSSQSHQYHSPYHFL